ncbi:Hachiman antiphage defense system protein HamA [Pseudomonas sp. RA_35y_Pfl2_P32]|uniref:Hachiman antiphage defense system protein HamA n=1 Tax=Pseudomonas sp. RA_35y_Pfl2_P32 TaxID=3088705 RepID=UPI0030DDA478
MQILSMHIGCEMTLEATHLSWLKQVGTLTSACGKPIPTFKLEYDALSHEIMSAWAKHFRNHYCQDDELQFLKNPLKTKSEYLLTEKFPHVSIAPGPSIRAGDFAEILVADYLQFIRNYQVPRTRYDRKAIANESTKGSDVIAFKKSPDIISDNDEMLIFEVKAKASESARANVLQDAIDHSIKDEIRIAESLSAMRQKLYDRRDSDGLQIVDRFQREPDHPCKRRYGAAAVYTESSMHESVVSTSATINHPSADKLELLLISGSQLMTLIHELYRRAADEA